MVQYFDEIKLRDLSESGELDVLEQPRARRMAIRGFQAVLDYFPESVTYDPTGTIPYRLATFAFNEIIGMGGSVKGDWVLVQTASGGTAAVRSAAIDPARASEEADDD